MKDACTKTIIGTTGEEDVFKTAKTGSYFLELSRLGLWPLSETLRKCSVERVLSKLSRYRNYKLDALSYNPFTKDHCGCKTCGADLQHDVRSIITEQRVSLTGLCLTCVRSGKTSLATGNCQNKDWCSGVDHVGGSTTPPDCEAAIPAEG